MNFGRAGNDPVQIEYGCIKVINEFISSQTRDIPRLTSGRALPSAVNRPLPRRPPGPRYARNFKSQIYNMKSEICNPEGGVPALSRTRPSVA